MTRTRSNLRMSIKINELFKGGYEWVVEIETAGDITPVDTGESGNLIEAKNSLLEYLSDLKRDISALEAEIKATMPQIEANEDVPNKSILQHFVDLLTRLSKKH